MSIDVDRVVGTEFGKSKAEWGPDQVILYHLGIGAGNPPTSAHELAYTYEGDNLRVIPSFATIPPFTSMLGVGAIDGVDINLAMLLHGEHEVELHRELPINGSAVNKSRVAAIYDKGKGALMEIETTTSDEEGPIFTNRAGLFIRGEGGFGGDPGPATISNKPNTQPDLTVESATLPQQALLYRLTGDRNPLHADPAFAALGGFDRPILHGLCSFGIILKAVIDGALDSDPSRIGRYRGRFAGVVYPGETIVTSIWKLPDGPSAGQFALEAAAKDRATPVLSNGVVELGG